MNIPLTLDSSKINNSVGGNFTVHFPSGIPLQEHLDSLRSHEIALVAADLWYTWHNIKASYGNNTFRYYNGSVWRDITLPDGNYQINDLNVYLHDKMVENNDYTTNTDGEKEYSINLLPNEVTIKVRVELSDSYQIDFSTSDLNELLGFEKQIYTTTVESPNRVDITRGINSLLIHCSLVNNSYDNGTAGDILYTFTPQVSRGSSIHVEPNNPIYVPISLASQINTINMRITDQQNRVIDFNGEPVTYFLLIRPTKKPL